VLTKDYRFNPEYQKAIEDKKVADQLVEKNRSAQQARREEYLKKLRDAEGEVNQMIARADGEYRKAELEADAYFEKQTLLAQAILAEGQAAAKGIRERNRALAGAGGETLVKLRIAEALQGKRILLLPGGQAGMDLRTTDVNGLLQMLGLRSLAPRTPPADDAPAND
jgi:ParB-like chromosome segregation protein Spo0J